MNNKASDPRFQKTWLYRQNRKKSKAYPVSKHGQIVIKDGSGQITGYFTPAKIQQAEKRQDKLKKTQTQAERLLIRFLKRHMNVIPQHVVYCAKTYYIIDAYIPGVKIAVEVDGRHHEEDPKQRQHDRLRDESLFNLGIRTLRFKNSEVLEDVKHIVNKICLAVSMSPGAEVMANQRRSRACCKLKR